MQKVRGLHVYMPCVHIEMRRAFAEKLLHEYQSGHVEQAVLLSLGNTSSLWFQPLLDYPICFHRGHIDFTRLSGERGSFGFPLAFVYLGPNTARFLETFAGFGRIVQAIDAPRRPPQACELWDLGQQQEQEGRPA